MLPHRWDITPREAIALQRALAARVRIEPLALPIRTIAGTDCAFVDQPPRGRKVRFGETRPDRILAVAVLCDARSMAVIAHSEVVLACAFPYVPGLLSFREAPAIIQAIGQLPARPDLVMVDGQGLAHPRGLGIASHLGLWLDMPTVGVAKSILCGEHRPLPPTRGARRQLVYRGTAVGAAVRTRTGVKPVYVSVGHRVTLMQAIAIAIRCATSARLPEPTRLAHQLVSRMKSSGRF